MPTFKFEKSRFKNVYQAIKGDHIYEMWFNHTDRYIKRQHWQLTVRRVDSQSWNYQTIFYKFFENKHLAMQYALQRLYDNNFYSNWRV